MYKIEDRNGRKFVGFWGGVSVWATSDEIDAKDYLAYSSAEYDVARLAELGHICHIRTSQNQDAVLAS